MKAIDLFAGAGGFTEGARQAGVEVLWAANHWRLATDTHALNHPDTAHACQDLHQADWTQVPRHDLLLASPACQGHSHSRGKERPHHDATRSSAWAVVACLEAHRSKFAVIENVPEFTGWGLFPSWIDALQRLGYQHEVNIVDAADYGVPQHRKRALIFLARGRQPPPMRKGTTEHRPIAEVIDWSDAPTWSPVHTPDRSKATLARIANGRRDFGDTFVFPYYSKGSGLTGRSIHRPIGTISTRARWAIVRGDRMRMLTVPEVRDAMSFPEGYRLPKSKASAIHLLGNAVPPLLARAALQSIQAA